MELIHGKKYKIKDDQLNIFTDAYYDRGEKAFYIDSDKPYLIPIGLVETIYDDDVTRLEARVSELKKQLYEGRQYLMSVEANDITVEDALDAFGFGRNGLERY